MSLQVWLPLNGNLNNQGLMEVTTSNTPVYASGGKFGKCLSNQIAISGYGDALQPSHTRSVSISCWFKCTTSDYLIACNAWEFRCSPSFVQFRLGNGGTNTYPATSPNKAKADVWNHIAGTWDSENKIVKVYLNGNLEASRQVSSDIDFNPISSAFTLPYNGTNTYVNDLRMYNHCLSPKEVKEISKGLVCHYKLDNNGFGNPNLITTMTPGGRTALNGKYGLNADFSQNLDTYGYFNVSPALELNSAYTLSFDVSNFPRGGAWSFNLWNNANYSTKTITKDGHYTYTFVPSESKLPNGYSLTKFLFDDAIRTNPAGTVYFTNFKIEKGSVATPWCPHTSDSLYASLGLDSATELDCSGLSNDGTKIGSLSPSASPLSARYESCYDFDGNTGSIQIPSLPTLVPSGEFTMNCWIYHDNTWSSEGYETIFGGPSGFELDAKQSTTNSPVLYACDWGKGKATYELNKWNMITMTRNASETKFYINGELKITGSAGSIPPGSYFVGAWKTSNEQNYKGRISDFRLYSTVLSLEDIKELYNISASIDKNGNMYAYEFKEE